MILKGFLNSPDKKRLFSNFVSLSVLQGANYILPLITFPYLVRVLGPSKYGLIAFAQAFIQYFNILTDYGFNLSATREISINREDKGKVSEIFSSVMIIKFALLILSFIIVTIIVFSFGKFKKDWLLYYLTFGMVIGQVLFPVWFFQGMERMKYITFLNITAKLIFTVCIFIFVHSVSDYIYVPLIRSLGFITAGVMALWIVFKEFKLRLSIPNLNVINYRLKEGWYIFLSEISGNLYGQGTIVILGIVSTNKIVGYYSVGEKLVKSIAGLSQPLAQAIYPFISKKTKEEIAYIFKNWGRIAVLVVLLFLILTFLPTNIFYFYLVKIHNCNLQITIVLLFIGMFFSILNVLKQPFVYALKLDKLNTRMYAFTGISFIPVCFLLSYLFNMIGTAISFLYVELVIFFWGLYLIQLGVKDVKTKFKCSN